jgi:hypothetical protein
MTAETVSFTPDEVVAIATKAVERAMLGSFRNIESAGDEKLATILRLVYQEKYFNAHAIDATDAAYNRKVAEHQKAAMLGPALP